MKFFPAVFAATALGLLVLGSPPPLHSIQAYDGRALWQIHRQTETGRVDANYLRAAHVHERYRCMDPHQWLASFLGPDDLNMLRASSDVEYIAEDGIIQPCIIRNDAPWNLERISHKTLSNHDPKSGPVRFEWFPANIACSSLNHPYAYDEPAGRGVDIYVVGAHSSPAPALQLLSVSCLQTQVSRSRTLSSTPVRDGAQPSALTPTPDGCLDDDGADAVVPLAGKTYGVARDANLIAVKVLSDQGPGEASDLISGLNWVAGAVGASGRPSVVNLSIEASASTAIDEAVTALVNRGIHVAVAAGNHNVDARDTSPARAAGANAVAASTINDTKADSPTSRLDWSKQQ
ncbi:putative peptidase [Lyophyllum shimeji]|uniref:Peptidase n=1 Tax=Lyophyllum shimeji TaxID=47721 RepID=A0A9P3PXA2_LYOSH|nr:putative peptidase [Lyophyllum shimeji]